MARARTEGMDADDAVHCRYRHARDANIPCCGARHGLDRPVASDLTGAPIYGGQNGAYINASAFTAPAAGRWGNAGRNSITGPNTSASMEQCSGLSAKQTFLS